MEKYWCTKANSIIDIMNGKTLPLALTPCLKVECDMWRDGECIHIRNAGKIGLFLLLLLWLYPETAGVTMVTPIA